jgi:hypothetical protein
VRKIEQYNIKDGKTPLNAEELSFRFLDIDGRLHQLELLKISWEQAVVEIQNHGLERINNTVQPVLDAASALVDEAQAEIDAIHTQWQTILDEWDGVADTLAAMQASLDSMQAEIDAAQAAMEAYTDAQIAAAIPVAPIPLNNWQTDPGQYTVLKQDAHDSAEKGKDLFYKYVFPAGVLSIMYSQIMLPFSGYDLQLIVQYRMSTSASGGVFWQVCWKEVSTNEADAELTTWAAFYDSLDNITDTPSATANQRNLISGQNLVIPSTAYNANGTLKLALMRQGTHENDTHAGDAEVYDSIVLVPVLP